VSTPVSGLVKTSSLCASKSDLLTSAGVRGDLGDGLALFQSHSYRLSREETIFPQLKGA